MDGRTGLFLVNILVIAAFSAIIIVNSLFLANILDGVCVNPDPFYQTYLLIVSIVVSVVGLYVSLSSLIGCDIPGNQYAEQYIIRVFRYSGLCFFNLLCFLLMSRNTAALVCSDDFKNYNVSSSAIFGFLPIVNIYFLVLSWMQYDYFLEFRDQLGTVKCFF